MRVYMIDKTKQRDYNCYDINETLTKFNNGDFRLIGDTNENDDLEKAYFESQNLETPWIHKKGVVSYATEAGTRSTMVGDIFCRESGPELEYFVVAGCGFVKLEGVDRW